MLNCYGRTKVRTYGDCRSGKRDYRGPGRPGPEQEPLLEVKLMEPLVPLLEVQLIGPVQLLLEVKLLEPLVPLVEPLVLGPK